MLTTHYRASQLVWVAPTSTHHRPRPRFCTCSRVPASCGPMRGSPTITQAGLAAARTRGLARPHCPRKPRTGFTDGDVPRLLYRARYYDRIAGTWRGRAGTSAAGRNSRDRIGSLSLSLSLSSSLDYDHDYDHDNDNEGGEALRTVLAASHPLAPPNLDPGAVCRNRDGSPVGLRCTRQARCSVRDFENSGLEEAPAWPGTCSLPRHRRGRRRIAPSQHVRDAPLPQPEPNP
jgi:hypothetical protein